MTIWISKFLGPLILAFSVPMIATPVIIQEMVKRFLADWPLIMISGALAMTAGLAIINTHNVWVLNWPLIVTLFGWLLLVGGTFRVVAPQVAERIGTAMMGRAKLLRVIGVLWALLGGFLTYKGYSSAW